VRAAQPVNDFVFGFGLFNADGVCCYGTNTYLEELNPQRLTGDAEATFTIDSLDLVEGTYKVDIAVHKIDGFSVRLSPAALYIPRQVAGPRRRHLPAAASMDILAGGRIQEAARLKPSRNMTQADAIALVERFGGRGKRSSSPTASSICSMSVTCDTCSTHAALAMRFSSV